MKNKRVQIYIVLCGGFADQVKKFAYVIYCLSALKKDAYDLFIIQPAGNVTHEIFGLHHLNIDRFHDYKLITYREKTFSKWWKFIMWWRKGKKHRWELDLRKYWNLIDLLKFKKKCIDKKYEHVLIITPTYKNQLGLFPESIDFFREIFSLKTPLNMKNKQERQKISKAKCSCLIHMRLGDALAGFLPSEYYASAIKKFETKLNNPKIKPTYFVFSNDLPLAKKTLSKIKKKFVFMNINDETQPYFELELMKTCQHFILSTGGFGWLAYTLSTSPDKIVIAPNWNEDAEMIRNLKSWHI